MRSAYDVTGIGNAIVDVLSHADDEFLRANNLVKGAMTLIDAARAEELYSRMGPAVEISGGSAGNTMAGIASLGGVGAYVGKVRDDQLGSVFRHDIRAAGVDFDTAAATDGPPTARSFILVTPDAERTMNTYLGACVDLGPTDVDEAVIAASKVTYMEGYLYDKPTAKAAFVKAAQAAHAAGRRVSLTLSDTFCVQRHHQDFLNLIEGHIDILFANEEELKALYETADLTQALAAVRGKCEIVAVTRSEKGCVVATNGDLIEVPAEPVAHVADTTGAGDLYAAGFLYGFTKGRTLTDCARLGSLAAAEVISHMGARPEISLAELARNKGLA